MTKSTKLVAALGVAAGIGVAALPFGAFAATYNPQPYEVTDQSADVQLQLTIAEGVGIAVDNGQATDPDGDTDKHHALIATSLNPNDAGTATGIVTIGTNSASGMKLVVNDKDTDTNLVGAGGIGNIPTSATVAAGTSAWGISGGALSSTTAMVASDAASPLTVYTGNQAEEIDQTMTYSFSTAPNQAAGVYTDVITYTVSVNE